jgi:glycosyltransferase involved in cell wall biosynthesis
MPLITVVICTYNSSHFILETLESVKLQTYNDIELIISDDASIDDTLKKVKDWIGRVENRARFCKVEILGVPENTGVGANANRGLKVAQGEWVKFLGGDDTLKPDCIENNMSFLSQRPEIRVLFSRAEVYKNTFEPLNLLYSTQDDTLNPKSIMASGRSSESQYKMLLTSDRIHFTPTAFLHRKTLLSVGGFDEKFKFLEDYPLWLTLTKSGIKLYCMDKVTVNYRLHLKALNNTGNKYLINLNYFRSEGFRKVYTYPFIPTDLRLAQRFNWYVSQIFRWNFLNRDTKLNKTLLVILTIYLNPFKYIIRLRKLFNMDKNSFEFYL